MKPVIDGTLLTSTCVEWFWKVWHCKMHTPNLVVAFSPARTFNGRTNTRLSNVKTPMGIVTAANTVNHQLFSFDGTNAHPVAPGA